MKGIQCALPAGAQGTHLQPLPSPFPPNQPAACILSLPHVTILCAWMVLPRGFRIVPISSDASGPPSHYPEGFLGRIQHILKVVFASVPSHAKPRQACRGTRAQTASPVALRLERGGTRRRKRGRARCSLGVVVHAGGCTSHSRGRYPAWARRGEPRHLPRSGIPRRSSRHKRGSAERRKMPTTPRAAMAARGPPLPVPPGGRRCGALA